LVNPKKNTVAGRPLFVRAKKDAATEQPLSVMAKKNTVAKQPLSVWANTISFMDSLLTRQPEATAGKG
jgi:hypothetical protein